MRSNATMRVGFGVMAAAVVAGCQHARQAPRPDPVGVSAFRFVEPPLIAAKSSQLVSVDEPDPRPMEVKFKSQPRPPLATPVYPPTLLGRVRLPVAVGVRLSVDGEGRVTQVSESLAALSSGGEFAEEFRVAVEVAVRQWRFQPAEIRSIVQMKSATGRGSYWQTLDKRPVEDAVDVAFVFTAAGEVRPELAR